jgi:hypothetical protein
VERSTVELGDLPTDVEPDIHHILTTHSLDEVHCSRLSTVADIPPGGGRLLRAETRADLAGPRPEVYTGATAFADQPRQWTRFIVTITSRGR